MKTQNILFIIAFTGLIISSCKKEKPADTSTNTGTSSPSNSYIFDGVSYKGYLGWRNGGGFQFFCSSQPGGGGDKKLKLYFFDKPAVGSYSIIDSYYNLDSTNTKCAIEVQHDSSYYHSTGSGTIVIGQNGTETTYKFTDIPLTGNKKVTGDFSY